MNGALLEVVRGLLERTYRLEPSLGDLGRYIVGDLGYRLIYAGRPQHRSVGHRACGARTLLRETPAGLHVRVYFPDAMIRRLERHPPQHGVHEQNVDEFATFVEEIDHLLLIAERTRRGRPVSLLELELQANVSKQLVLERFLAGGRARLDPARRRWLRRRLFGEPGGGDEPALRARYRDAARYAVRWLDRVARLPPAQRLAALRHFHAASCRLKLELIERG